MNEKLDWKWLPQWTPTFAVLVALLAAVVPASFHLGGEMSRLGSEIRRLDEGQTELKAGLARLESRVDSLGTRMETRMEAFETRMETRMDAFEARIESLLGRMHQDVREDSTEVANLRERVAALEAAS